MEYRAEKNVNLPAEQIFTIISNVNDYHYFLPWCQGSKMIETIAPNHHLGALLIGFQHFKEKLVSEVRVDAEKMRVEMRVPVVKAYQHHQQYANAVKELYAYWQLNSVGTQEHPQTNVQFYIDFNMKIKLYNHMLKLMMKNTIDNMAEAFVIRAQEMQK